MISNLLFNLNFFLLNFNFSYFFLYFTFISFLLLVIVPNVETLNNNLPMNSSFLNTLATLLNIKNIPTIYLTCLGKKINKDTQLEEQVINIIETYDKYKFKIYI